MGNDKETRSQLGLFVLSSPKPDWAARHGPPTLDIVAVHGLNGNYMDSWTDIDSKVPSMWLRDMLPKKLPNARIMAFGYNADTRGTTSIGGVRDNSRKLLELLRDKREDNENTQRHIVFLGHSLGGIIIKQALRIAENEQPRFSDIAASAKGIIFFGTPHRGASIAKWLAIASGITASAFNKPKSAFVDVLQPNSKDLMDISEDFRSIATKYAIVSFYEEDVNKIVGSVIVEKHSAVMEVPHEEQMMLGGDHSSICKYGSYDDRFEAVWMRIRRAAKGPSS